MQPTKHTLISEIIGRLYVRKNARNNKMVGRSLNLYDTFKPDRVRVVPCVGVVPNYSAYNDRCVEARQRGFERFEQGNI